MLVLAQLLADALPAPPDAWGDFALKVGLGILAFFFFTGGCAWIIRHLFSELKASRAEFLVALDKQHNDHAAENHLLAEQHERNTDRIVEAVEALTTEIRYTTGRATGTGGSNR